MRKSLASGFGVAAALVVLFGSGSAGAINEYNGQTYAKAAETLTSYGANFAIATREGSYLPTEKCIVVGTRKNSGKWLLDLNCNDTTALNGHPGNSVTTPDGKKALELRKTAKDLSSNYANNVAKGTEPACLSADNNTRYCIKVCTETKLCSAELNEALGI